MRTWFETDLHKELPQAMNPGDYLRNYREAAGITQKDLAGKNLHPCPIIFPIWKRVSGNKQDERKKNLHRYLT